MNTQTDGAELFDLFTAPGVTTDEVALMRLWTLERQIAELRRDDPDTLPLSSGMIAQAILVYARSDAGLTESRVTTIVINAVTRERVRVLAERRGLAPKNHLSGLIGELVAEEYERITST